MAWAYPSTDLHGRWTKGLGALLTVAVHVVVIALILVVRTKQPSEPIPLSVNLIAAPAPQSRPQPIKQPLNLSAQIAALRVPQPEILLADTNTATTVAIDNAAPPPSTTVTTQTVPTTPRFDADYLNNPAPRYPTLARRKREQGVVMLRVYVLPNGLPEAIELKRSSGIECLDKSALEAVRRWRFIPARSGDVAVAAWVVVPIEFSLAA